MPKPIAATAFVLAAFGLGGGAAKADTITKERFGCHSQAVTERLFQFVQAGDASGFEQLLQGSLSSGECRSWTKGEAVTVEKRAISYGCMKAETSGDACFWTPLSAIEPEAKP